MIVNGFVVLRDKVNGGFFLHRKGSLAHDKRLHANSRAEARLLAEMQKPVKQAA